MSVIKTINDEWKDCVSKKERTISKVSSISDREELTPFFRGYKPTFYFRSHKS